MGNYQSSYTIDSGFRFVAFGGGWAVEAEKNGQPGLLPDRLTGTDLFDHIIGAATIRYFRSVLHLARASDTPVRLPYRCDTTSHGRLFEMEILPESSGALTVRHTLKQVRPYPVAAASRPALGGSVCSVCCRVNTDGVWRETGLPPHPEMFVRDCTVCPFCIDEARRRLPGFSMG